MGIFRVAGTVAALLLTFSAAAHAAVVSLVWDPSATATGYVVQWGTTSGVYSHQVDVGDRTSLVVDLEGGKPYFFAVYAYSAAGKSANSTEISASLAVDLTATGSLDLQVSAASIDLSYEPSSRRFLIPYAIGGQIWGVLLDVWGNQAGPPFVIVPNGTNAEPRVAGGAGGFMVTYSANGQRFARSVRGVGGTPTVSGAYTLGPAAEASAAQDNAGNGLVYVPEASAFLATWGNGEDVMIREIGLTGVIGPSVGVTTDVTDPDCVFERSDIAWDPKYGRAMVIGNRTGASCASGDGLWSRLMSYDGNTISAAGPFGVVSTTSGPQRFRRVAFSDMQGRFLIAWSEPSAAGDTALYSFADATGGMSSPAEVFSGGAATAELEDDSFIEHALAADATGGFALVSRGAPPSTSAEGHLHLFRIGSGQTSGIERPQRLPASGGRMHTVMAANPLTGQLVAAYISSDSRIRTVTIGVQTPTIVYVSAPASATPVGSAVTLTAQGAGGAGPYEYEFWRHHAAQGWTSMRSYSSSPTLAWAPGLDDVGTNTFQVWVRSAGSVAQYEGWRGVDVRVSPPAPRTVTVAPDQTTAPAGTPVTWNAAAAGGLGAPEYQFWIYDTAKRSWFIGQAWSASKHFTIVPLAVGSYYAQVWVRTSGSTGSAEAWANSAEVLMTAPQQLSVSVTPDRVVAEPLTPIVWQAKGRGGTGPYQYQFWRYDVEARTFTMVQTYGSSSSYTWTPGPTDAGTYSVQVWARSAGSSASLDGWANSAAATVTNVRLTSLTSSVSLPRRVGTSITWTAKATKAAGLVEYQYWLYSVATGSWELVRPYDTPASWTWVPSEPGKYVLQVWARTAGSSRSYEAWLSTASLTINP